MLRYLHVFHCHGVLHRPLSQQGTNQMVVNCRANCHTLFMSYLQHPIGRCKKNERSRGKEKNKRLDRIKNIIGLID